MTNDFLPSTYEVPETEKNYLKPNEASLVRILSSAIVGWEYWTVDKKPIRARVAWEEAPDDAKVNKNGTFQKHFWAFLCYDHKSKKVKIMEITQKSIQDTIKSYVGNPKWGDPKTYDLAFSHTGEGLETEYMVIAEPHTPSPVAQIPSVDIDLLFKGEDPFATK